MKRTKNYRLTQGSREICYLCGQSKPFTRNQLDYFSELGLSDDAVKLYNVIRAHGEITALIAGDCLHKLPNALYRLFYEMEQLGLVSRIADRPVRFRYTDPVVGYSSAYTVKTHRISKLLADTGEGILAHDQPEILIGKTAMYERYVPMADAACEQIRLYTIGIAYSDEFVQVQRMAIERGAQIRHIIQERRPSNYHILNTWRKMGVNIRFLPSPRGFHLMIFDDSAAMVTFSSPDDTENRVTIVIRHLGSITPLIALFESLWQESGQIKWLDGGK